MNDAPIGQLATQAFSLLIDAVATIGPDDWDRPSNLEGWSVRELVGHATGSAAKVVTLVEDGELWQGPSQPADWVCEDPSERLRELASRLRDALPSADLDATRVSPQGQVPLRRALAFPVADLAMHAWDVHRSQGRLVELPDDTLAFCRGLVESVAPELLRRPGGFGPARPAPDGATPTAGLMAYLGRSVDG
ncbi:TIGR03086 family metal-binding protein [Mycobacterium sp. Marseille-P9652]|uniref:TIGR03086 family metal-binding protein n=1 Tax=Mycobacterium sp. Marseille-P9652 TaxID=2654950 RepID=UPI0012E82401|nr:TIGR03086 family metal-binding protein [Mycobacterium sp. Marseille-P9652]